MKEILQTKEADEGNTTDKVDKSFGERMFAGTFLTGY